MNSISTDLFYKIRSRFTGLKLGKENGEITIVPEEASFFDFDYMDGENPIGHVSISLAEPSSMKVYYSTGITESMGITQKDNWYTFLKELRMFAKRRLMSFDTRDIAKDNLDKRDYQFLVQNAKKNNPNQVGESIMSESNMYGTSKTSFQKLMDTKLIIKHSKSVDENQVGARARNISALFVENQAGERFKYPFVHLAGARAMQRHIANGGVPYDDIGKSIVGMSEEIAQLKSFGNYVVRNDLMNSDTNNIVERSSAALNSIRETLARLAKQHHYEAYRENFQAGQALEVPQAVAEDFKEKFTVKNFKEDIASVFPVLYRLMQEEQASKEIGYDDIVEMTGNEEDEVEEDFEAADPFAKFENWAMNLGETSAIQSDDADEKSQAIANLQPLVAQTFPAGVDGTNAIQSLKGIIDDAELEAGIKAASKEDSEKDVRGMVQAWLQNNAPEALETLDFGDYADTTGEEEAGAAGVAPVAPVDAAPAPEAVPQESIDEAGEDEAAKQKRKWMGYWKDYDKSPEDFGVKPNANAGKPYPKYTKTQRPGTTKSWEVDYTYDNPDEKTAYDQNDKAYRDQPEYKAYSDARTAHHKEMEKVKKSHYAQKGRFDSTITIMNPFFDPNDKEDEDTPEEIDVGVDYEVEYDGEDSPGSWDEPPESAERYVNISRVVDLDTGEDITAHVDQEAIEKALDDQGDIMSASDYAQDMKDQAAIDRYEANRESVETEPTDKVVQKKSPVQELAEFIHSFYDKETNSFPKGPEGVCTMVGKKYGEQAEAMARKFVGRMAPQQATEQNPELAELARIKKLSGM